MKRLVGLLILGCVWAQVAGAATEYTLTTQTGFELTGLSAAGLNNSDFRTTTNRPGALILKSKSDADREVKVFTYPGKQHVYIEDGRESGNPEKPKLVSVTSAIVEDGKVKSQINCVNPTPTKAACYVVTREVCDVMLRESGLRSFEELGEQVGKCDDLMKNYRSAVGRTEVSASIDRAYVEHNQLNMKETGEWEKLLRIKLPQYFGELPLLKSAGQVKHMTDFRLYGMLRICSNYMSKNSLQVASAAPVAPQKVPAQ